jgi:hypothetical protein
VDLDDCIWIDVLSVDKVGKVCASCESTPGLARLTIEAQRQQRVREL